MTSPGTDTVGLFALMERYIDGDKRAFAELHRRLEPRLRGFLLKLLPDEASCDDLVQLTLLKAHLARDRFTVPGGDRDRAVRAWYFAIARNVAMDGLRERYRATRRAAPSANADGDPVTDLVDDRPSVEELGAAVEREQDIIDRVREAIARLPATQREVVELHKLRGMSMADIATRLQVREGAVRVRAHRAYKALARLLEPRSTASAWWVVLFGLAADMITGGWS